MMHRISLGLLAFLPATALVLSAPDAPKVSRPPGSFAKDVLPAFQKYCFACHSGQTPMGGISLDRDPDESSILKNRELWTKVAQNLTNRRMPPPNMPQPSDAERGHLARWIEAYFASVDCVLRDPGRVTLRRLNRAEYNNTIRDLVGVDFKPADDFPSDDVGYGFDNIGDVLSISPIHLEKYLAAAETISQKAIFAEEGDAPITRLEAEDPKETAGEGQPTDRFRLLTSTGEVSAEIDAPHAGDYLLRVRAAGQQAGPEVARMAVRVDGKDLAVLDVAALESAPEVYRLRTALSPGKHKLSAGFVNDYYRPDDPNPRNRDRNLLVDYLELVGPVAAPPAQLPTTHADIITCHRGAAHTPDCAKNLVRAFATRAFRRPVSDEEVTRLARYVTLAQREGDSFERGMQLAVQATLVSPHFLFLVEADEKPNDPKAVRTLNDYELASRLSYFLWSSMPDNDLFAAAAQGTLKDRAVLIAQTRRMLKDPKSAAFVDNFAGQWLQLRRMEQLSPDPKLFAMFDDKLRDDMATESLKFFDAILREDRNVLELLDADFVFVNERLARLYGIPGVKGEAIRRVALKGALAQTRGGILTQASVLTLSSNPTRTSPVKRGKWIMEQILGVPPPPPPPNVEQLDEGQEAIRSGSLRQRMEAHRKNPNCATCHTQMDALGFAFENYDAIGAWRDRDGSFPIDPSGILPDGKSFRGPAEMKKILKGPKKNDFVSCLTEKMLTYALGRGLEFRDRCFIDDIARSVAANRYRMSSLIAAIVTSDPFRMRRGDEGKS